MYIHTYIHTYIYIYIYIYIKNNTFISKRVILFRRIGRNRYITRLETNVLFLIYIYIYIYICIGIFVDD